MTSMTHTTHAPATTGVSNATGRGTADSERIDLLCGPWGAARHRILEWLKRANLLWRFNFSMRGQFRGEPVVIPFIYGNGAQQLRVGEQWMVDALQTVLAEVGGTFVDVGVNLGQTLLKVKMLDPAREYVGFEPNPQAFHYASELVERNRFTGCTLVPVGLSNETNVVTLFSKADADPSASIVPGFREPARYRRSQAVAVFGGDQLIAGFSARVGVVKIDVEGGEFEVVEGLSRTIERDQPCIFCEVLPVFDPETATGALRLRRQQQLETLLHGLGYSLFQLLPDGRIEPLEHFAVHGDMARSNYVFTPGGLSHVFADAGARRSAPPLTPGGLRS